MKKAFEEYYTSDNVVLRIDFTKYNNLVVTSTNIQERIYSPQQLEAILQQLHIIQQQTISSYETYHRSTVTVKTVLSAFALELQILCGLRRGEVCPLLWSDKCNY